MTTTPPPPFAAMRLIYLALVLGMTAYAIVAAVLLQGRGGKGMAEAPIPEFDTIVPIVGAAVAATALLARHLLLRPLAAAAAAARPTLRFRATLIALALLEGGCLFALTAWLLNGNTVPHLAVAMVLLALAIALVPLSDPDATAN
jgi:hypothetical protein